MIKTKIDWCDSTWNPVTGCLHGCTYCYARNITQRFGGWKYTPGMARINITDDKTYIAPIKAYYGEASETEHGTIADIKDPFLTPECHKAPFPFGFTPTFHRYRLDDYKDKKGRNIFVCSMADLFGSWVPDEWIQEVFKACEAAPQHRYLFLTKNPERYKEFERYYHSNMWLGMSYTHMVDGIIPGARDILGVHNQNLFMSLEPILEPLHFGVMKYYIKWAILGAETGNRKNKIIPKYEWIKNIVDECRTVNIPVYMKNSLAPIWGEPLIQEFPW